MLIPGTLKTTIQSKELFVKALQGNNFSDKTIRAYGDDLEQFFAWIGKCRVDWDNPVKFSRIDIIEFMNHEAALNLTGVTRRRKLAAIRKYFQFLVENSVIANNPANTVKGAKREKKEPVILYKEQYKALLYEASESVRDYAIILTFLQTGIRLSELKNLKMEDVDLENKILFVRQGKGKYDREIPILDDTIKALRNYVRYRNTELVIDDDIFFLAKNGTSLSDSTIKHIVQKYAKKAGVKKKISVHTLRHTFGAHKAEKGMNIASLQKLMGHKMKETTLHYIHIANMNLREEMVKTRL